MAVATALAIGGLAVSAASTAGSFIQAGQQRRLQQQAQADAEKAMAEARKKLEVNYFDQLGIQKEPYELQREALLAQGAEAIQAGAESERGVGAVAGRVQQAQVEAQQGIRTAMGKELTDIEKLKAEEDARLRDLKVKLDLGEVAGQQQMAADAQRAAAAATAQGFQGLSSVATQAMNFVPLYEKTAAARQAGQIQKTSMGTGTGQYGLSQSDMQKSIASMGNVNNVDLSKVSNMNPMEYNAFMGGLDVNTLKQIKAKMPTSMSSFNPEYQNNINPFRFFQP